MAILKIKNGDTWQNIDAIRGDTGPQGPQGPPFTGGLIPTGWFENTTALNSGAINLSLGNCFTLTISVNTTITITNAQHCSVFILVLTNGGSATINWPANVKWNDNIPPELITSGTDILMFVSPDGGTTFYGVQAVMGVNV